MKNSYHLKEDGFEARWFEGTSHKEKAVIWMHGSGMNEKHCLVDSESMRKAGYSVLVLGFYFWKGMPKAMRAIPVEYVERAAAELRRSGFEKIGIHGISSGAAYALLCASLIPEISLVLSICPFDYVMEEPKIFRKPTGRSFQLSWKRLPLFTLYRPTGKGLLRLSAGVPAAGQVASGRISPLPLRKRDADGVLPHQGRKHEGGRAAHRA